MAKDYDIIKKYYGEKFAQYCRSNFSTILEMGEGVLSEHIMSLFAPNKSLFEDLVKHDIEIDAKSYITSTFFKYKMPRPTREEEHPSVLMKKAGYTLYECKTAKEVESFKKYYQLGEQLCTFRDINGRLDRCHVFFAVKDNVENIRRRDFKSPRRQDEYGTSVISLQFTKGELNDVSIKNRYNHTVEDPDATFSNDLENIYPGLTDSFAQHYGFNFDSREMHLEIPGYIMAQDGKMYKYNLEYGRAYFCPDNVVIKNDEVYQLDKYSKILVGNYIFDIHKKTIHKAFENNLEELDINDFDLPQLDTNDNFDDSFIASIGKIAKMDISKADVPGSRVINITKEDGKKVHVEIDKNNDIVSVVNNDVKVVGDEYLSQFRNIDNIQMDNLEECGYNFALSAKKLKNVNFPNLKYCGGNFLYMDREILSFNAPNLISVGSNFCINDRALKKLYLPNLERCGDNFFRNNTKIEDADFSKLKKCGKSFLECNDELAIFTANQLQECGDNFMSKNDKLKVLRLPNLKKCGAYFCCFNTILEKCQINKLEECGSYLMYEHPAMRKKVFEQCADTLKNDDKNCFIVANEKF